VPTQSIKQYDHLRNIQYTKIRTRLCVTLYVHFLCFSVKAKSLKYSCYSSVMQPNILELQHQEDNKLGRAHTVYFMYLQMLKMS
jgi:hypothetical protein